MSAKHLELRRLDCAQRSFEHHLFELRQDMNRGVPVRHLWVRVELLEELVERTGGSLVTEAYRVRLCEMKKCVALRALRHRGLRRETKLKEVAL